MAEIKVTLNGRTYRFTCGDGDEARIEMLAGFLASRLEALGQDQSRTGDDRLLVMAALHIADELFEAHEKLGQQPSATVQPLKAASRK